MTTKKVIIWIAGFLVISGIFFVMQSQSFPAQREVSQTLQNPVMGNITIGTIDNCETVKVGLRWLWKCSMNVDPVDLATFNQISDKNLISMEEQFSIKPEGVTLSYGSVVNNRVIITAVPYLVNLHYQGRFFWGNYELQSIEISDDGRLVTLNSKAVTSNVLTGSFIAMIVVWFLLPFVVPSKYGGI